MLLFGDLPILVARRGDIPSGCASRPPPSPRRFRPTPLRFAETVSNVRRPSSRGGGLPTTCWGSTACWATDAGATPERLAAVWLRVGRATVERVDDCSGVNPPAGRTAHTRCPAGPSRR